MAHNLIKNNFYAFAPVTINYKEIKCNFVANFIGF